MKNCVEMAETFLWQQSSLGAYILNQKLTPIEAALFAVRLYDMATDYQRGKIGRRLESAQREHYVLDINGKVQLVYDSLREAEERAEQLGGSVISGASK
jgi:hypothetical protein